ncbi:hypothetical protein BDU57DRAFT_594836 [Ampelomyces quisqualis]|uniref:Uncharacterized protein n=1 Tax=Ampelomyces quisqualis TaxID=50730 RepID=A0A6A5QNG5_AMPQU|nr:hypothetical protein BDU57DRAFT_594836 [Ampelomyces quisqualis]
MLFFSSVLLCLVTSTLALPAPAPEAHLVARAKIPASVTCERTTFSVNEIKQTIANAKIPRQASNGKEYPDYFGNRSGSTTLFGNIPASSNLYGQPLTNPAWTGGPPGKYRVILNEKFNFVGVVVHTSHNLFKTCTITP